MDEGPKPEDCPKLKPDEEVVVVLPPKTEAFCPNPEFCPNAGAVLCPKGPPPVLLLALLAVCTKEKELALLVLDDPKSPALLDGGVEAACCPKAVVEPKADCPKVKLFAELLAGWPKPDGCPKAGFPNPELEPNPGAPNPELAVAAAVIPGGCPKAAVGADVVCVVMGVGAAAAAVTD